MNLFVCQQKNFIRTFMKKDDKKILLLGGKGFLGQGLLVIGFWPLAIGYWLTTSLLSFGCARGKSLSKLQTPLEN